ncbi:MULTISPECIES: sugar O-acetyltransferase [Prauserella salsuginis group]|uniref:Sugar O-acetyltransferase n=1 Tax=Prauserella salsuginis TaxID=387889 RepID=A0ABW6G8T8_9PSEU|nr:MULTISPECIES: sugar O-acetyltransferase [Prauserella salsuginis group]MCR3722522.1 maltose O-acetyltransferase [Prauserella flava]MCR3736964.1 maltose O-acetyltransferase [Prauserella salsuginis]
MGEHKERMLRGEWYLDEPELAEDRRRCRRLVDRFNAAAADEDALRRGLLTELVALLGDGAAVEQPFRCSYGTQIRLGASAFVNSDAIFMDDAPITIGDDVRIGPRAQLLTALHPMDDHERRRAGWERPEPITIGDNSWLGGGVIVCPGVTIGENAVIGAGSVVVRDVPGHVFAAGNPARVIRSLDGG